MKFRTLTLEGFQSYYERESLTLANLNLVAITGPNGAGKSSLLDAIEWALYGRYRGEGVRSVVARGADRAEVTVEFSLAENIYQVTRTRTASGRHEVVLRAQAPESPSGWKELTEKNPAMADPEIASRLGMNSATARATWMIGQNDFGTFCELKPAARRTMLANTFGLEVYARLAEKAKDALGETRNDLRLAQERRQSIETRLQVLDQADGPYVDLSDEELEQEAQRAESAAEEAVSDLGTVIDAQEASDAEQKATRELSDYQEGFRALRAKYQQAVEQRARAMQFAQQALAKAKTDYEHASEAVWLVDDAKADAAKAQEGVAAAESAAAQERDRKANAEQQIATLTTELEATKRQGNEINQQVASLNASIAKGEGQCFTCGQALSLDKAQELVREQEQKKSELLDLYRDRDQSLKSTSNVAEATRQSIREAETGIREAREAEKRAEYKVAQLVALADSEPTAGRSLAEAEKNLAAAEEDAANLGEPPEAPDPERTAELEAALTKARADVAAAADAAATRERLRQARNAARSKERTIWAEQERRRQAEKERQELAEPLQTATDDVLALTRRELHYTTLYRAFQPGGIPALMLNGIVEELNADANDILSTIGGDIGVRVSMSREKQGGGSEEKVMIYARTPSGEVDYATLSGAEKFRVALAIRCAKMKGMARRTGIPMQTLCLDEGWGALDEETTRAVQGMLTRLSQEFSIFTVSHIDDVKSSFPTVIEVSKASGTSATTIKDRAAV